MATKSRAKKSKSDDGAEVVTGTILDAREAVPGFFIGTFRVTDSNGQSEDHAFVGGQIYVLPGYEATMTGIWTEHERYGPQFKVKHIHYGKLEMNPTGLEIWLDRHGAAKGIGPKKAKLLVDKFGTDFGRVLTEEPEKIAEVAGIRPAWVEDLAAFWKDHHADVAGVSGLLELGFDMGQANAIAIAMGPGAADAIRVDPFCASKVDGIGFTTADKIASGLGTPKDSPTRIRAGVVYTFLEAVTGQGSTCCEAGELTEWAVKLLKLSDHVGLVERGITDCLAAKELVEIGPYITNPFYRSCETSIALFLKSLYQPNPFFAATEVESVARRHYAAANLDADADQLDAVQLGLRHRGALICGGAGCGKTTILKVLLRAYRERGATVSLCAPTGKAAKRMEQVTGQTASTIHRLLRYNPKLGWRYNSENKLDADVIICDEASMLSSDLSWRLFQAIRSDAVCILVGDHHQLPPVDPGAVLRDCTEHRLLPTKILKTSHRQAGVLKRNSAAILTGTMLPNVRPNPTAGNEADRKFAWVVGDTFPNAEDAAKKVVDIFTNFVPDRLGLDPMKDLQVIVPMVKENPISAPRLNRMLQKAWHEKHGRRVPDWGKGRPGFLAGDRVIQTKNNYKMDVMNGHQGIVMNPPAQGTHGAGMMVQWEDKRDDNGELEMTIIKPEWMGDISLSYALTCHKCQGSEWRAVVFVCHTVNYFMLDRTLLYTAATRAKETLMVVGNMEGIQTAARVVKDMKRKTLLKWLSER